MDRKELRQLACKDRRDLPFELCDLKFDTKDAADSTDSVTFEGYASVWGRVDSYGDTVIKGAFAQALKDRRPMMLYGHNPGRVIGKFVSATEDDKGLLVKGMTTPGNSDACDVAASLKFGAMSGLSIGGYTTDWETTKQGGRLIKAFDLYEISVVAMPAEQDARIDTQSIKSALDACDSISDMEELLREAAGLSKSMATAFVARLRRLSRGEPAPSPANQKAASELLEALKGTTIPTSLFEGKQQ